MIQYISWPPLDKPVVYKTGDPKSGKWQVVNPAFPIGMIDPYFFVDDDGTLVFLLRMFE